MDELSPHKIAEKPAVMSVEIWQNPIRLNITNEQKSYKSSWFSLRLKLKKKSQKKQFSNAPAMRRIQKGGKGKVKAQG